MWLTGFDSCWMRVYFYNYVFKIMPKVAITKGDNRYQNVYRVLQFIKDELAEKIAGKRNIVIKPNLCVAGNELAVTNVKAIEAILDFLRNELQVSQNIIIAEGPFESRGLDYCLNDYKYNQLENIRFVDLNQDDCQEFSIEGIKINLAKTILESDFLISICPAKTHDSVITTLSIKNVAVGSIIVKPTAAGNCYRNLIHGSPNKINKIISSVVQYVMPSLAIIDGSVAMEGDGPVNGDRVDWGVVLAGLDAVAVDSVCSYLMGFEPNEIGYLYYLNNGIFDINNIEILGFKDAEKYKKKFKPHSSYQEQLKWREGRCG